jgi:hypothetical protein
MSLQFAVGFVIFLLIVFGLLAAGQRPKCPFCRNPVNQHARSCGSCGRDLPKRAGSF